MRKTIFSGFAALLLLILGCDPKKDPIIPPAEEQDFSCIKLFDDVGQTWGIHGCTASDDWGKIPLSASEQVFLNFSDTVSLNGTVASTIIKFGVFPCPVKIESPLGVALLGDTPDQPVKLKMAIVDESLQVVWQLAIRAKTSNTLYIYMDPSKFESGKYYRMYYRISASGAPSLYEGFGNFLVCKDYIITVEGIESGCM